MDGAPQDKPPPLPSKEPFVIGEDIELGDVHNVSEPPSPKNGLVEQYEGDLDGDDSDHVDDGSTALLGAEGRARGTERLDTSGWGQVSGIVLEVCVRSQRNERAIA